MTKKEEHTRRKIIIKKRTQIRIVISMKSIKNVKKKLQHFSLQLGTIQFWSKFFAAPMLKIKKS